MAAEIVQFDDPLNPRGWVLEPTRRRLAIAFPDVEWTVRPAGMVESWDDYDGAEVAGGRAGMAAACARMSEQYGMPIDEYLWFESPPASSWPACRAIAAAGLGSQGRDGDGTGAGDGEGNGDVSGGEAACRLLRGCREATFARRTSISDDDHLREVVESVPDLDANAVETAIGDGRAAEAFEAARDEAAALDGPGVRRAGGRCELPTLLVRADGRETGVSGVADFPTYRDAVADVTGREPTESTLGVDEVIARFSPEGWVARVELAHLAGRPEDDVEERARELVGSGELVEETLAAEPFWRLAALAGDSSGAAADTSGS